jgi:glycosyltransferase involved in cell wall biosynthesis
MKNLLFFCSDFEIGLSALTVDQLIDLHKSGANIISIGGDTEQEAGLGDKIIHNGIQLHRISGLDIHSEFKRKAKEIADIVKAHDIDIIHVQNNWQLALVSYVKYILRPRKFKVIYTIHAYRHNNTAKSYIARAIIATSLLLFADNVICMCKFLKSKFKILSYKIKLLPLGINDEYFTDNFEKCDKNGLHLVFPAQFRHGKNQDLIIRAFHRHIRETNDNDSRLLLPGNGPLIEDMKSLVTELGIEDRVIIPGQKTKAETKELYIQSNIGIVASNCETFGQSIVEPYVLGRCVISTPVGIATEIVKDGQSGYIFHTEEDLVKILNDLYRNQDKLETIGRYNFSNRAKFRWSTISQEYINYFLQ